MAVLLFLGSIFVNVWTERLWFTSVGYRDVFSTVLVTRIGLFVTLGGLFALFVVANLMIAYRKRPVSVPTTQNDPASRYRTALAPVLRAGTLGAFVVLAVFSGSVAASQWKTFQLWRNGTSLGQKDAHFGKDLGFFMFDYPWLRFVTSFSFAMIVVAIVGALFMHYVYGGVRFAGRGPKLTRAAQVHLAVLVGLAVLSRAATYWLDRFGLAVGTSSLFDGIGYTDANARIPSKNILIVVAIVCALLFFAVIVTRSWVLPGIGLALLALTSILIGGVWPAAMQEFQVKPSEPDKEGPYIERNIEATRAAYALAGAKSESFSAKTELSRSELAASAESRISSRLLDPTLVSDAFQQLQQVRGYYTVPKALDVDRYPVGKDGKREDLIIAARELNLKGLQSSQRNWSNDHTVYTHGYGIIAARGNERGSQGEPVWVQKDIPPVGDLKITTPPRIYFGENSPDYSIVGRPKGAKPIEVDTPRGGAGAAGGETEGVTSTNTYDGEGGVKIGNIFNKLLYAAKFAEPNIVLSGRVNENSKILYDRNPRERVEKVAPWLTVDGDAYPAVVDGRVVWIIDGYTTSNTYPYSEHKSLREATADTLTADRSLAALPTDQVNYIRNSVKAVVDAYDGTVDLYQWDTKDPVLKAWMKVFPDTVKPRSEIDKPLLEHLRYPVDLFKVQRDVLTRYHVTDPQTFYEDGERWRVPTDPTKGSNSNIMQPPYYLSMSRPGEEAPEFSLTTVFLPNSRENLASFVSVNSEATSEDYGSMQILELPSNTQVPGPSQMANQFQADGGVTQALLQFEQARNASIERGNLLTIPVDDALLYVQPVYIRRTAEGSYPVLQFVAASFGEDVGFGRTLDEALNVARGESPADSEGEEPSGGEGGGSQEKSTAEHLEDASRFYNRAQDALKKGDLAAYQQRIERMNDSLEKAQASLKKE